MSSKHKKSVSHGAEDLDGNFAVEPLDFDADGASSAASDSEHGAAVAGAGVPKARGSTVDVAAAKSGKKRKRSEMSSESDKPKAGAEDNSAEQQALMFWNAFLASKTGEKLADQEISSPLSAKHLTYIPASVVPTANTASNDVSDITGAIKHALPGWKKVFGWKAGAAKRASGQPEVLIVTFAAARAASMLKPLSAFKTRIAKCFAKHLTVDQQKEILAGPPVTMAIGTPNRLQKLVEEGALSLEKCSLVVVDVHPDMKKYTLLHHPNLREDFFSFYRECVHPRLAADKMKMALY